MRAVGNNPTVYKLQDQAGEDIKGTFYSKEIQKVAEPESYRIKKGNFIKRTFYSKEILKVIVSKR